MEIKVTRNIDLAWRGVPPIIDAVQGETDVRIIELVLFAAGSPFNVDGCVSSLAFKKPDGTSGWYDTLPDGNLAYVNTGNVIEIKIAPQVLTAPGEVKAVVRIETQDGSGRVTTFPLIINVVADPAIDGVKSENYYSVQNWDEVNVAISEFRGLTQKDLDMNWNSLTNVSSIIIASRSGISGSRITWGTNDNNVPSGSSPYGRLMFTEQKNGGKVRLGNIAPGTYKTDAVNVEQMEMAVKDTIDRICPAFTESGAIVTCEPVEGYPLSVSCDTFTWGSENYLEGFDWVRDWTSTLHILNLNPGTYKVWVVLVEDLKYTDRYANLRVKKSTDGGESWTTEGVVIDYETFTHQEVIFNVTDDPNEGWALEIEDAGIGLVHCEWMGINKDINRITRCGKNCFDFTQQADQLTIPTLSGGTMTRRGFAVSLPAGTYTLHAESRTTSEDGKFLSVAIARADGTYKEGFNLLWAEANNIHTKTIEQGDTIYMYHGYSSVSQAQLDALFKFTDIQIEVGKTATAFEAYTAETFDPGDTIPALSGVNTIYADAGLVTVTGRANPVPIINSVLDRLAAVEATIVNNT